MLGPPDLLLLPSYLQVTQHSPGETGSPWLRQVDCWLAKRQMDGQAQRVVVNGDTSSWWMVTSEVPLNSAMGLVLFNIIIDDLESFSKPSDSTKLDWSGALLENRKVL